MLFDLSIHISVSASGRTYAVTFSISRWPFANDGATLEVKFRPYSFNSANNLVSILEQGLSENHNFFNNKKVHVEANQQKRDADFSENWLGNSTNIEVGLSSSIFSTSYFYYLTKF